VVPARSTAGSGLDSGSFTAFFFVAICDLLG
jgi:hypothetical protein